MRNNNLKIKTFFTFLIAIVLISSLMTACKKKNETIVIEGKLYDSQLNTFVQGAKVNIFSKFIDSGTYNPNFRLTANTVSDDQGRYSIELEKRTYSELYIDIEKENYFMPKQNIELEKLTSNDPIVMDLNVFPLSEITLKVRNQTQYSNSDYIAYQFLNQIVTCETCCNNLPKYGIGKTFSAEHNCNVLGNSWVKVFWGVEIGGGSYSKTDSVYCKAFENTVFEIVY